MPNYRTTPQENSICTRNVALIDEILSFWAHSCSLLLRHTKTHLWSLVILCPLYLSFVFIHTSFVFYTYPGIFQPSVRNLYSSAVNHSCDEIKPLKHQCGKVFRKWKNRAEDGRISDDRTNISVQSIRWRHDSEHYHSWAPWDNVIFCQCFGAL